MCKFCHFKGGCTLAIIAKVFVVIGGINWGIIGLGMVLGKGQTWNVISMIAGSMPVLEAIIYLVMGVSAVMVAFGCGCEKCESENCCLASKESTVEETM